MLEVIGLYVQCTLLYTNSIAIGSEPLVSFEAEFINWFGRDVKYRTRMGGLNL